MNTIPSAMAAPIVAALNHLLAQEPWARGQLAPFAGKTVRFDGAAFVLALRIDEHGKVEALGSQPAPGSGTEPPPAAVTLIVPMQQWPLVVADVGAGGQAAAMKHVRIEGDAELANVVSGLARHLRWDAAEDLARAFRGVLGGPMGDSVAQRMVEGARAAHDHATRMGRALVENVTEYLLDERPTLVRHAALDDFSAHVSALRDDLARIEKRLERLERGGAARPAAPAGAASGSHLNSLPSAHR